MCVAEEAHISTQAPADWRRSTFSTFSFGGAAAFSSVAASAFSVCLRSRRVDMRSDIASAEISRAAARVG